MLYTFTVTTLICKMFAQWRRADPEALARGRDRRTARPAWLQLETRRIEAGLGSWEGADRPVFPARESYLGSAVSSPNGLRAKRRLLLILVWFKVPILCLITCFASRLGRWSPLARMDPPLSVNRRVSDLRRFPKSTSCWSRRRWRFRRFWGRQGARVRWIRHLAVDGDHSNDLYATKLSPVRRRTGPPSRTGKIALSPFSVARNVLWLSHERNSRSAHQRTENFNKNHNNNTLFAILYSVLKSDDTIGTG